MARQHTPPATAAVIEALKKERQDLVIGTTLPGEEKRADIFSRFAEVLMNDTDETYADFNARYLMAMSAWNLAVTSPHARPKYLAEILQSMPDNLRLEVKNELAWLISRKEQDCAQYDWFIANFELTEKGKTFHLTVLSIP
jgi:hypothetical protein